MQRPVPVRSGEARWLSPVIMTDRAEMRVDTRAILIGAFDAGVMTKAGDVRMEARVIEIEK